MAFDADTLQQARQAGYSDDEIYGQMSAHDPRFIDARTNGYSLDEVAQHLGQQPAVIPESAPSITEQFSGDPTEAIQKTLNAPGGIAKNALEGAAEEIKKLIPTSLAQLGQPDIPSDLVSTFGPEVMVLPQLAQQVRSRIQQVQQAEQTPAFSKERFAAGFGTLSDVAQLALGLRSAEVTPTLTETLTKRPEIAPLQETLGFKEPPAPEPTLPTAREITPEVIAANEALAKTEQPLAAKVAPQVQIQAAEAPSVADQRTQILQSFSKKMHDESQGQMVLSSAESEGRTPASIVSDFWNDTFQNLPKSVQSKFQRYIRNETDLTHSEITSEGGYAEIYSPKEAGDKFQNLEGTQRGLIALMKVANDNFGSQVNIGIGGEQYASQITSPEGIPQPEVRPPVGEEAPLRQPGEVAAPRQGIEAGTEAAPQDQITLYHSTPKQFEAFTGTGTPTGLGGRAFYFSDKPEPAYGENVVPVSIPKNKILDISRPDIPFKNDAEIRKAGYEGTFNPQTGEYTVYDPNKFISKPVPPEQAAPSAAEAPPAIGKPIENGIPAEPPEGEQKQVGLTKEFISEDRAARGEEPLAEQARKTNAETWDKAGQAFAQNPNVGHELVASLTENPRPVTEDDLGILLRHRVNLQNQTDFEAQRAFASDTPPSQKGQSLVNLNALADARNEADNVTRMAGGQAGKTMQFLQRISNEDYTLSGMAQQARIAQGGKELSEVQLRDTGEYSKDIMEKDRLWQEYLRKPKAESALAAYKSRLKTATTDYERRIAFQDFEPQIRKQLELDPEAVRLQGELNRAKIHWQKELIKYQAASKPTWMKVLSGISYLAREGALSGYHTLAKLASFTGERLAEIPLTETAERVWGQIPGFKQIAAQSEFGPGANAQQLGKFYSEFFTTGMKDALTQLRTGVSTVRAAFGKEKIRPGYQSFFGNIHGAEKTPLLTGSFAMNRAKLMSQELSRLSAQGISEGSDVTAPPVQAAINYKAFQRATYDILQEQNQFADGINGFLAKMEARSKATGEFSPEKATMAAIIRTFATKGIVRTPANYIMQSIERTPVGLIRGIGRAGRAFYKGVDNVSPAERSAIMKLMGVGSVGSGMFLWGALDAMKPPDHRIFGGYYQPGEKRDPNDVPFGAMKVGGKTLPHILTHNPMTESAQMASTMMRVALSSMSKKDRTNKGIVTGLLTSVFGLAEQAPVANPLFRAAKLGDPRTQGSFVGEQVRGLIPMAVQNVAADMDKSTAGRKPSGIVETAKLGIPVLREQVQEKKVKGSNVSRFKK